MTDERFEDLFQEKAVSRKKLQPGDRIKATIAGISGENIFLDIGGKSEGIIDAGELRNEEGELTAAAGDVLQVFFLSQRGGELIFTTRIGSGQASAQELEDAFHSRIPVQGKVSSEVKGGFEVTMAGQRAFCPYSQMDLRRIEDPADYLDKTFSFRIIEFGSRGRNIIVSARAILEEEREKQRKELEQTLSEGMRVSGTVTSVRNFGAFVDLGGIDGLIPIAELAWGQTERTEDILQPGQQVEVIIKQLDWERDRISLSLRETTENPWDRVTEKYSPGTILQGTVSRLTDFGAFVALEPGVDGLIHISKLGAGRRINHPREVLEKDQQITVKVENVDQEKKRISLVPEDFSAASPDEDIPAPPKPVQPQTMGTLGDLLQSQLKKKK